jgi:hypothetical protein
MTSRARKSVIIGILLLVSSTMSLSAPSPFESGGIRSGLKRSPGDYVAAVIEYRGTVTCGDAGGERRCWSYAAVIDEMAARPASKSPRTTLKVLAGRETGERAEGRSIAFLVPIEGTDLYGATYLSVYTRSGHERFREAVEMAIGGTAPL